MAQKIRQQIVRMTELHRKLGGVIHRVALSSEHFVVEKGGLPVAVMMSYQEYEQLMRERAQAAHRNLVGSLGKEAQEQGLTEEQLQADLEETKKEVYQDAYGTD